MKKTIVFVILLLMIFVIPIGTDAEEEGVRIGNEIFEYDGNEKYLELLNVPADVSQDSIVWEITASGSSISQTATGSSVSIGSEVVSGQYSVVVDNGEDTDVPDGTEDSDVPEGEGSTTTSDDAVDVDIPNEVDIPEETEVVEYTAEISGSYGISQRIITVKPNDVNEEYYGQTIIPKDFSVISGNLVDGHKMTAVFSGVNNKVGEVASGISSYVITDEYANPTADNYLVDTQSGKLILSEPFIATTDREPVPIITGGTTATPSRTTPAAVTVSSAQSSAVTASGDAIGETETATSEGAVTTQIGDVEVPLDDGIQDVVSDGEEPLVTEANSTLGTILFIGAFVIAAAIIIGSVARYRRRIRNNVYY